MLVIPTADSVPLIYSTVKGAIGEAEITDLQKMVIEAMVHDILKSDIDFDSVPPFTPEQAQANVRDKYLRDQITQTLVALELLAPTADWHRGGSGLKGRMDRSQAQRVEKYAQALGSDLPQLTLMRHMAQGNAKLATADIALRGGVRTVALENIKESGLGSFVKGMASMRGHGENTQLVDKFKRLEDLPDGSWGKALINMYHANGWGYPGQTHEVAEPVTVHDWVHVLTGYPPSVMGELQVGAFIHASSPDPLSFGFVAGILAGYGIGGIKPVILNGETKGYGLADRSDVGQGVAEALLRSKAVGIDLLSGIDHWGQAHKSVEEMRAKYRIPPKTVDVGDPDPGLA